MDKVRFWYPSAKLFPVYKTSAVITGPNAELNPIALPITPQATPKLFSSTTYFIDGVKHVYNIARP